MYWTRRSIAQRNFIKKMPRVVTFSVIGSVCAGVASSVPGGSVLEEKPISFETLFEKLGFSVDDYEPTEFQYFRDNYQRHLQQETKEMRGGDSLSEDDLKTIFIESEPVATEKKARSLNARVKGWEAENSLRFSGWSVRDAKASMGTFVGAAYKPLLQTYSEQNMTVPVFELPSEFSSVEKWGNECPTIAHIRDQSTCGSCW